MGHQPKGGSHGRKAFAALDTRMLAWVPTNCPLLFPFYLSAQLSMTEEVYSSPHLPPAFDGYRIAYASDIHFGPYLAQSARWTCTSAFRSSRPTCSS
jgi:hypothetical protein